MEGIVWLDPFWRDLAAGSITAAGWDSSRPWEIWVYALFRTFRHSVSGV
jgi:hypothetical protein